jgi:tetratricopeptide (TPR) repeat protein
LHLSCTSSPFPISPSRPTVNYEGGSVSLIMTQRVDIIEQAHKVNRDSVDLYYLEAEALTSLGGFEEAKDRLKTVLKLNPLFAPAYNLFGSLFSEEGKVEEAKKSFKKAIYLNKDFTLAHFSLANIRLV